MDDNKTCKSPTLTHVSNGGSTNDKTFLINFNQTLQPPKFSIKKDLHHMHIVSRRGYNLSAPLLQFLSFSLVILREREAIKDERTHYSTVDKF